MRCVILAAGYATRLYPLTENKPKHLLPVAGKPLLNYILEKIVNYVEDATVVTNAKFYPVFKEWADNLGYAKPLHVINDGTSTNETRLGGVGDFNLGLKEQKIDDDVLLICGDNLFEFNMHDFDSFYKEKNEVVIAAYDVKKKELAKLFGILAIDEHNKVTEFQEKPEEPKSTLASTGLYIIPKRYVELLDEYAKSGHSMDGPGFFIKWLAEKHPVYAFVFTEGWWDIGSHDQYKEVNEIYNHKIEKNKEPQGFAKTLSKST